MSGEPSTARTSVPVSDTVVGPAPKGESGDMRSAGTNSSPCWALTQPNSSIAPPPPSKYSSITGTGTSAASGSVASVRVGAWPTQLSMTSSPSTKSRTPSSERTKSV